ncbi:MAG TPA: hypothetical protein VJ183_08260 [Chloroflexia bacterium]|nr:hypothetical protein [Chloroflexia bacterium]
MNNWQRALLQLTFKIALKVGTEVLKRKFAAAGRQKAAQMPKLVEESARNGDAGKTKTAQEALSGHQSSHTTAQHVMDMQNVRHAANMNAINNIGNTGS